MSLSRQRSRPLIKPGHGNPLSVRLSAEMKGDYSQLGLMPGRYLEQIDLPSAYLWPCSLPFSFIGGIELR
jgi:hypothetical protein